MRTLITALAFLCAITNALLLADWILRREAIHAAAAGALLLLCLVVATLAHRLRE